MRDGNERERGVSLALPNLQAEAVEMYSATVYCVGV